MIEYTCIRKRRAKRGAVMGYLLKDKDGRIVDLTAREVKCLFTSNCITLTNLSLTKDGRLVDKKENKDKIGKRQQSLENIKKMMAKAKLMGRLEELESACNRLVYLMHLTDTQHILYIPDEVELVCSYATSKVHKRLKELSGSIAVVGGQNVTSFVMLFADCRFDSIDCSLMCTDNAYYMSDMFCNCKVPILDLSSFNTENVLECAGMFSASTIDKLNISSFNTEQIRDFSNMFSTCRAREIYFPTILYTGAATNMEGMFRHLKTIKLDLSYFKIPAECNANKIFENLMVNKLIIHERLRLYYDLMKDDIYAKDIEWVDYVPV